MVVNFNSVSEGFIYAQNLTISTISAVDINAGRYFQVRTLQGNQTFISPAVRFLSPLSDANNRNIIINPGINKNNEIVSNITFLDSDTNNTIDVYKDRFLFNGAPITVSSIGNSLSNLCQLPSKSGTIALLDDVPNSLSCTPSTFYKVVGAPTISSGFNIYRNLSLKLSYGVLYCFCDVTLTPGQGVKQTAYAIGFRINDSTSEDEQVYAIISTSNFILGGYYQYPLKLE